MTDGWKDGIDGMGVGTRENLGNRGSVHTSLSFSGVCIVISVRMGPGRRSGPFKTTRLMVKLHQAYVLASEGLDR